MNLVLFVFDAVRADHLGCYGYARPTTPELDGLARRGVLFRDMTSPAHFTLMSFASLFASRHADAIGVFRRGQDRPIPPAELFLSQVLKGAGFDTLAFTQGAFLTEEFGFARGFDAFHYDLEGDALTGRIREALEERGAGRRRPFFLFVHLCYAHDPYLSPDSHRFDPGYAGWFDRAWRAPRPRQVNFPNTFNAFRRRGPESGNPFEAAVYEVFRSPREQAHVVAHYDGAIAYQDGLLGDVRGILAELGALDETVFAMTADHGEELGERGRFGHQSYLYQSVVHVPFVVCGPRLPAGRRVAEPVHAMDIAPTLLDLLDVPQPPSFQGVSLRPLWEEAVADGFRGRVLFASSTLWEDGHWAKAARRGEWKLICTPAGLELYNLADDPDERREMSAERPDQAEALAAALEEHLRVLRPVGGPSDGPAFALPDRVVDRLRRLGYVD